VRCVCGVFVCLYTFTRVWSVCLCSVVCVCVFQYIILVRPHEYTDNIILHIHIGGYSRPQQAEQRCVCVCVFLFIIRVGQYKYPDCDVCVCVFMYILHCNLFHIHKVAVPVRSKKSGDVCVCVFMYILHACQCEYTDCKILHMHTCT